MFIKSAVPGLSTRTASIFQVALIVLVGTLASLPRAPEPDPLPTVAADVPAVAAPAPAPAAPQEANLSFSTIEVVSAFAAVRSTVVALRAPVVTSRAHRCSGWCSSPGAGGRRSGCGADERARWCVSNHAEVKSQDPRGLVTFCRGMYSFLSITVTGTMTQNGAPRSGRRRRIRLRRRERRPREMRPGDQRDRAGGAGAALEAAPGGRTHRADVPPVSAKGE